MLGIVVEYDPVTRVLTVRTPNGVVVTLAVPHDAEVDIDDDCMPETWDDESSGSGSGLDPSLESLPPGSVIGESKSTSKQARSRRSSCPADDRASRGPADGGTPAVARAQGSRVRTSLC